MDDGEAAYLDERPALGLPPINVIGMVKMVPDVEHLELFVSAHSYNI